MAPGGAASDEPSKGPDQVVPVTCRTTTRRNGAVHLRLEKSGLGAEEPLSVPGLLQRVAEVHHDVVAMRAKEGDQWVEWTYGALLDQVRCVGRALVEAGLLRHHSVALLGGNSPHWVIAHLAAIFAGGIAAGVAEHLGPEEIARICIDCKADVIMVEQEAALKKVLLVQHKLPELKCIIQWRGEPPVSDQRRLARSHKKHILSWAGLLELGKLNPVGRDPLEERLTKVSINQCCSLVYATSNKGVMLSHDNLTWSAKMALGVIRAPGFNRTPSPGEEVMISFLPLSHISTQLIDIYYMISVAGTTVFPNTDILNNRDNFFAALKEVRLTVLYGPPVVFERLYHKLVEMRRALSGLQKSIVDWSRNRVWGQQQDCILPNTDTKLSNIQHSIAKKTVCKKYKESLGLGPKTIFICRGGALPDRVLHFLSGFDIVVHSAYGQSECCSLLTANIPKRFCKFSSVGKPGPGVRMRLGEGGEVQGEGRNIFMGYLNRENDTRDVMTEDSWLRTGDRATVDDKGFLVLSCFPADLVTLFSGEEVEPSRLEDRVRRELGCVAHCVVVGQGRENLAVLLSLDTEVEVGGGPSTRLTPAAQQWFRAARFEVKTVAEVMDAVELGIKHVIQAGIDRTNLEAERGSYFLTAWEILPHSFSLVTGELGQTGKVNRLFLAEKFARTINRMYTGEDYPEAPRKRSAEKFMVSHQLSNIVEDDEKSQRESQDKELRETRNIKEEVTEEERAEEEEIAEKKERAESGDEEARRGVKEISISEKDSITKHEEAEDSDKSEDNPEEDKREDTGDLVEVAAVIESPSKHDEITMFGDTVEQEEEVVRGRRMSRS